MLGACRGECGLLGMDGAAELRKLFGEARAFRLGFGAAEGCGVVLVPGALCALPCGLHVRANTRKFVLADREFQPKPRQLALHVTMTVRGGDDLALDFT